MALGVGTLNTPTLVSSASTNAQYISTSGTGSTNAAQETYNFVASTGSANITGLKFAMLPSTDSSTTALTLTGGTDGATGAHTFTVSSGGGAFTANDNILVTTNGVYGGQAAIGTVTSSASGSVVVNLTTPLVYGCTSTTGVASGTTCVGGTAGSTFVIHKLVS